MHPKKKQKKQTEKRKETETETPLPSFSHAKAKSPGGEGDKCGGVCIGTLALTLETLLLHYNTLLCIPLHIITWAYKPTATLL